MSFSVNGRHCTFVAGYICLFAAATVRRVCNAKHLKCVISLSVIYVLLYVSFFFYLRFSFSTRTTTTLPYFPHPVFFFFVRFSATLLLPFLASTLLLSRIFFFFFFFLHVQDRCQTNVLATCIGSRSAWYVP